MDQETWGFQTINKTTLDWSKRRAPKSLLQPCGEGLATHSSAHFKPLFERVLLGGGAGRIYQ